jgi:hypothetical protein
MMGPDIKKRTPDEQQSHHQDYEDQVAVDLPGAVPGQGYRLFLQVAAGG